MFMFLYEFSELKIMLSGFTYMYLYILNNLCKVSILITVLTPDSLFFFDTIFVSWVSLNTVPRDVEIALNLGL